MTMIRACCKGGRCVSNLIDKTPSHSVNVCVRDLSGKSQRFKAFKEDQDFIGWQQQIRENFRKKTEAKGLAKFDETVYNESMKLTLQDEDPENEKEKKIAILKSAIQLYNERQPRLKQDHPQFVNWCVLRMYEFDIVDNVELYEMLFECFPSHMYRTYGVIASYIPKPNPGYYAAMDLVMIGQQRKVKPSYKLYYNVVKAFGERHQITRMVRRWGWFHYVMRNANPYPLPAQTSQTHLAVNHEEMAGFVADRTLDQRCKMEKVVDSAGEYMGHAVTSRTMEDLALLQVPDDNMRMTGPHSIWVGNVQRWYWVLRREERGHEFEGAPLGLFVSPYKDLSRQGAQIWLENCRESYKGIAGSNILFDVPDETLYINPEEHFKERVSLFSDGIEEVHVEDSILPDLVDEKRKQFVKKVAPSKNIKFIRDKSAKDKDDEW